MYRRFHWHQCIHSTSLWHDCISSAGKVRAQGTILCSKLKKTSAILASYTMQTPQHAITSETGLYSKHEGCEVLVDKFNIQLVICHTLYSVFSTLAKSRAR